MAPRGNLAVFPIDKYGSVKTVAEAQVAFQAAVAAARRAGGGIVEISPETVPAFLVDQSLVDVPVRDPRLGPILVQLPEQGQAASGSANYPASPLLLRRTQEHVPSKVYGTDRLTGLLQRNIHGGSSIQTELLDPSESGLAVQAGPAAKWYPASIEGFFAGQHFLVNGKPTPLLTVIGFGWDSDVGAPYFTADAPIPVPALFNGEPSFAENKSDFGVVGIISEDHCANQSSALSVSKYAYSQGDSGGISTFLYYQGDIISAEGDEGGLGYTAELIHDLRNFRGTVGAFDPSTGILRYRPNAVGPTNTERLGTSRPLINLNQHKWITGGSVRIWVTDTYRNSGALEIKHGVIEGIGTSWGQEVIGRYFAVNDATEYIDPKATGYYVPPEGPDPLYRWFRIVRLVTDGNTQLLLVRLVVGGTQFGAPQVADPGNLAHNNPSGKPLGYIIAPGAIVADVTGGVNENDNGIEATTVLLQPNADFTRAEYAFAPGDPIEQAIGPQPWNPTGFRVRHFTNFPSATTLSDVSFLSENRGTARVDVGLLLQGESDLPRAKEKYLKGGVAYGIGIDIQGVTQVGVRLEGDIQPLDLYAAATFLGVGTPDAGLAITLQQHTGNKKVIAWSTANSSHYATIGFDPEISSYRLAGAKSIDMANASIIQVGGLSDSSQPAANLRGINIAVGSGMNSIDVTFPIEESDTAYGIQVTPSWPTTAAVTAKNTTGFTVWFGTPPSEGDMFDWFLVR
jgi:hypothetical protein